MIWHIVIMNDKETYIKRLEKCLTRIAVAHGIKTPLELTAMAKNDDENYAEILARYVEKKMT